MEKKDYYELLGIDKNADEAGIKSAYRKLAMKYHPDRNPGNKEAEEKFKEINEAYEVLSDPNKRAQYDQFGHAAFSQGGPGAGGFSFEGFSFEDLLSGMFGGGSFGGFGGGFGGGFQRGPRMTKGQNVELEVQVTFEEAAFGKKVDLEYLRTEECEHCSGTGGEPGATKSKCTTCNGTGTQQFVQRSLFGEAISTRTCPTCQGKGESYSKQCSVCKGKTKVRKRTKKTITIPAGVDNGTVLSMRAEGDLGSNGGPRGDLYVHISVKPHKEFLRKGNDIYYDLKISYAQAVLGANIVVPTIDEKVKLTVPAGTPAGKRLKIKGKGFPILNGYGKGDMYVIIDIVVPQSLDKNQRELLLKFDESLSGEHSQHDQPKKKGLFGKKKE